MTELQKQTVQALSFHGPDEIMGFLQKVCFRFKPWEINLHPDTKDKDEYLGRRYDMLRLLEKFETEPTLQNLVHFADMFAHCLESSGDFYNILRQDLRDDIGLWKAAVVYARSLLEDLAEILEEEILDAKGAYILKAAEADLNLKTLDSPMTDEQKIANKLMGRMQEKNLTMMAGSFNQQMEQQREQQKGALLARKLTNTSIVEFRSDTVINELVELHRIICRALGNMAIKKWEIADELVMSIDYKHALLWFERGAKNEIIEGPYSPIPLNKVVNHPNIFEEMEWLPSGHNTQAAKNVRSILSQPWRNKSEEISNFDRIETGLIDMLLSANKETQQHLLEHNNRDFI